MADLDDLTYTKRWNIYLILISIAISFLGCYLSVSCCEIYRYMSSSTKHHKHKLLNRTSSLLLMSVAFGGIGVWSMHFIALGSLKLSLDGKHAEFGYNMGLNLISLAVSLVFVFAGIFISSQDRVYSKDKNALIKMLADDTSRAGKDVRNKFDLYKIALFKGPQKIIIGGVIAGIGISLMHYLGMMGLCFPGKMYVNIGYVIASGLIAIIASISAIWILFRLLSLFPSSEAIRLISAIVMCFAICGMHFTGEKATEYKYRENIDRVVNFMNNGHDHSHCADSSFATLVVIATAFIAYIIGSMVVLLESKHTYMVSLQQLYETDYLISRVLHDSHQQFTREELLRQYSMIRHFDSSFFDTKTQKVNNTANINNSSNPNYNKVFPEMNINNDNNNNSNFKRFEVFSMNANNGSFVSHFHGRESSLSRIDRRSMMDRDSVMVSIAAREAKNSETIADCNNNNENNSNKSNKSNNNSDKNNNDNNININNNDNDKSNA